MFIGKNVGHELPENANDKKIEDADPDEKTACQPGLLPGWDRAHQNVKNDQIGDEESIGDRNESSPRHARDNGREEHVRDQHRHQCAGVHPRQFFDTSFRADIVADGANDIIAAENDEVEKEPEPQCAQLVGTHIDNPI